MASERKDRVPISVVILTYNEEKNIRDALESVSAWADEIFVVDSGSGDSTCSIAQEYTPNVVTHGFESFTKQWRWALEELPIGNDWVLGLDADQRITKELADEIIEMFRGGTIEVDGFYINRRQYFLGRWIKHGTYYPRYLLKLFRLSKLNLDVGELMDHHFYVDGRTTHLNNDLIEDNKNETLDFWVAKHNKYASLQAAEEFNSAPQSVDPSGLLGNQDQRRLVLLRFWRALPLLIRAFLYFVYRYFFRLGFLDGREGLIFHFLQGFWYRFLVDAKIFEMRKGEHNEANSSSE